MRRIFISYAREDRAHAQKLLAALVETGVEGWMDATDIASGAAVSKAVRSAIERSGAIVVLLSPKSLHNKWVNFEVGAGLALGRPIIPIIVEGPGLEHELQETLHGIHILDARNRPIEQVAKDVEAALE